MQHAEKNLERDRDRDRSTENKIAYIKYGRKAITKGPRDTETIAKFYRYIYNNKYGNRANKQTI
jgi:hypothetical protein